MGKQLKIRDLGPPGKRDGLSRGDRNAIFNCLSDKHLRP